MDTIQKLIVFLILLTLSLHISAMEIDQLTDREKYQDSTVDFTHELNKYTNSLIIKAVDNYNSQYADIRMTQKEIHALFAFEIFKETAGRRSDQYRSPIPTHLTLAYALTKSGTGPIQEWIQGSENKNYWFQLNDNFYSNIIPETYNKNYIIKVADEFIGPDKIDHFFDQGYSYWIKSENGKYDMKAKEFGVDSEYGWYGLMAAGVFSFADLRANWAGYQFYKCLFNGESSHFLISSEGLVSIRRQFNWNEHIDWQFDELKNPSIYTHSNMKRIEQFILGNYDRYRETYLFLKEQNFFSWFDKRENFYLIDGLNFNNKEFFDVRSYITEF